MNNFINEIIWHYKTFQGQTQGYFARKHDVLFWYSKNPGQFQYEQVFDTDFEDTIDSKRWASYLNDQGQITGANMPMQDSRFTRYLNKWIRTHGRKPNQNDVIFEVKGQPVDDVWHMKGLDPKSLERVAYATQKPEALLERVIKASTKKDSLVLDCFCGSGTTATVAEKLGRRWITCDLGRFSIHTARKRLLGVEGVKPFHVQNLGKYERQQWVKEEFAEPQDRLAQEQAYRHFILSLYHAQPLLGHTWLHGDGTWLKDQLTASGLPINTPLPDVDPARLVRGIALMVQGSGLPRTPAATDVFTWAHLPPADARARP